MNDESTGPRMRKRKRFSLSWLFHQRALFHHAISGEAAVFVQNIGVPESCFFGGRELKTETRRTVFQFNIGKDFLAVRVTPERFQVVTVPFPHQRLRGGDFVAHKVENPGTPSGLQPTVKALKHAEPFGRGAQMVLQKQWGLRRPRVLRLGGTGRDKRRRDDLGDQAAPGQDWPETGMAGKSGPQTATSSSQNS